jgi:nucleotide-binding universal stress UspA family protein
MTDHNIRKILVPVDFSECSKEALEYAELIAERFGASLVVMHAWRLPPELEIAPPYLDMIPYERQMREEIEAKLSDLVSPLAGRARIPIERRLEEGHAPDMILVSAKSLDVDLIVMGTHGRRGFKRFMLGSVAEQIVRLAPCPVLTVGSPKSEESQTKSHAA